MNVLHDLGCSVVSSNNTKVTSMSSAALEEAEKHILKPLANMYPSVLGNALFRICSVISSRACPSLHGAGLNPSMYSYMRYS